MIFQPNYWILPSQQRLIGHSITQIQPITQTFQLLNEAKELPIDIVFRNLSYSIFVKDERSSWCRWYPKVRKDILLDVTGIIRHGRVTAIMGASGAGKTSLLNILACRVDRRRGNLIAGEVLANMRPYSYESFGNFANYVMQHDILMQTLTVRETLEFAASLAMSLPSEQRSAAIEELLRNLKLDKCADVLVGGHEVKGISGGEKKRVSIAYELISDPQVVFLDEPTSGLDSLTAYVIVWYMKRLALDRNKTVAMTIHQPSSEIFELFDDFLLMVAGRLVYQGPARDVSAYFGRMGFPTPQYSNPPDYLMSIMHDEYSHNVANYPRYYMAYESIIAPKVKQAILAS